MQYHDAIRQRLAILWDDHVENYELRYGRKCAEKKFTFNPLDVAAGAAVAVLEVSQTE